MSNEFDPYYNWLGISPDEQPADHYRLLAIRRFETNVDVISNASDQRMGHIRTFQTGKRAAESQRILNELSAATRCLLDPELKKKYDLQLKAQLNAKKAAAAPVTAKPVTATPVAVAKPVAKAVASKSAVGVAKKPVATAQPVPAQVEIIPEAKPAFNVAVESPAEKLDKKRKKPQSILPLVLAGVGIFAFVATVAVGGIYMALRSKPAPEIAVQPVVPITPPPIVPAETETTPAEKIPAEKEASVKGTELPAESTKTKPKPKPSSPEMKNPPVVTARNVWKYEKSPEGFSGTIREVEPKNWVENRSDGLVSNFVEQSRDDREIALYDTTRKIHFRLTASSMMFRRDDSPISNYTFCMNGAWAAAAEGNTNNVATKPSGEMPATEPAGAKRTLIFNGKAKATIEAKGTPLLDVEKPFTLEFWYTHKGALSDSPGLLHCGDLQLNITPSGTEERSRCYSMGVESNVVSSAEMNLDRKWHHIALVRNGEMLSLFVDGRHQIRMLFDKLNLASLTPVIFGEATNAESNLRKFMGEIRSIRVSNTALYAGQATFTPPESLGFQIPGDVNLNLDGAILVNGHPENEVASTGSNPTGTMPASNNVAGKLDPELMKPKQDLMLTFDGNSKITLESTEPVLESGKDCTIEYWFRRSDTSKQYCPLLKFGNSNALLTFNTSGSTSLGLFRTNSSTFNTLNMGSNEWHHVVFQVEADMIRCWLDGRNATSGPLRSTQDSGPVSPVEIGRGNRFSENISLTGEIRSLKIAPVKLYDSNGPGVLNYDSVEHGIYIPKAISLSMSGVKSRSTDGGIIPRNSLADLTKTQATNRLPTPEKEQLDIAKGTVASVFGVKIKAAVKAEQKSELAHEMLKTAISEKDTALAYALLGEARTQAMGSLNIELLLEIIAEVDRRFSVDRLTILSKLLPDANKDKLSVEQREVLVAEAMKTAMIALNAEKIGIANDLSDLATNAVKVSKSIELKKAVRASRDQILAIKAIYEDAQKAIATLAQNGNDPEANLVAGKYYVLGMENFEKGLPCLAKAANSPLAVAAQKELKAKSKEERCAVAEAWYEVAATLKSHEKLIAQRHVALQYEAVVNDVTGILQAKAKERLAELKPILDEVDKAKQSVAKSIHSKKPIPGLIFRIVSGYSSAAIQTPYLGVALSRQDLSRGAYYQYTEKYPNSSSPSFQLIGMVYLEKDMDVIINLSNCECMLDNTPIDTQSTSQAINNKKVPMKKGIHPIMINSIYTGAGFQFSRADTGENLLFHNEEMMNAQLNVQAALPNGLPSKGIRVDGVRNDN